MTNSWTDDRVALLKKLWAEGLSASQIANRLGGVTRNGVIGKKFRLRLPERVTTSRAVRKSVAASVAAPKRSAKPQSPAIAQLRAAVAACAPASAPIVHADVMEPPAVIAPETPRLEVPVEPKREAAAKAAPVPSPIIPTVVAQPMTAPSQPKPTGEGISLFELRNPSGKQPGTCRWPLDLRSSAVTTLYCGADALPGRAYCRDHCQQAFQSSRIWRPVAPVDVRTLPAKPRLAEFLR